MKKLNQFFYLLSALFILGFTACKTDNEQPTPAADVIVINEGNFNSADASLSSYNSQNQQVSFGIFESVNGFPIAGTIQNVISYQNKLYFVTNSADKLEIADAATLSSVKTLRNTFNTTNFSNPYSFAAVGNKGYVSNWGALQPDFSYANPYITLIDLSNNTVSGKINRAVQPQHLWAIGQNIYIANVGGNTISVLNTADNQIATDITVADSPDKMLVDKNNKLWVICRSGNLVRINPANNTVEATIAIDGQGIFSNARLETNAAKDKLYWLGSSGKVFEMAISATTAPTSPIITEAQAYGLGIDKNNQIYVADHNGYVGNGEVHIYQLNGTKLHSFNAGRIPSGFIFK
jgi:YVTN family beta-propeller protein